MYQTSSDSAVASDQPCAMIGCSESAALGSFAFASAYTVASEATATSRAASPGTSAMQICQLKPSGANTVVIAWPMRPAKLHDAQRGDYWGLGFSPASAPLPGYDASLRYGPLRAVPAAFRETGKMFSDSMSMIRRMVAGAASVKNVSGPITIARYANATAQMGPAWFLSFLALLSLSLAIINLLPIPILDGGHLLYYLIELVKGSPLSESAMAAGQYLGLAVLAGLMGLAFYNDIAGLLH